MADPRQPGPPVAPEPSEPPPDRLQRWFAAEVRAAERDVKRGLVSLPTMSMRRGALGRRGLAGGAVAASAVVVLLVVALSSGFLGGTVGPSPTTGSGGATGTPAVAGPSAVVVMGLYGLPSSIDGEPVLTVAETLVRVPQTTDDTPFLVGGIFGPLAMKCPAEIQPEPSIVSRLTACGGDGLTDPVAAGGMAVKVTNNVGAITAETAVVVRVHTHDAAAAGCPGPWFTPCQLALVIETVEWTPAMTATGPTSSPFGPLYADGIPSTFEGQPVLRPSQAAARAAASTDASTFVVGGWVGTVYSYTGCAKPSGSEGDQVLTRTFCGTYLNESPTSVTEGPLELHFRTSVSADWQGVGPAIVRVHTHDPLATTCAAANQDACAHAVVVDALLWNGPALGSDGLPSWMDGQSTISVPEAQGMLAHFDSPAELEVRGWYSGFALPCPFIPATVPPTPGSSLLPENCQPSILGAAPIPLGQDHAGPDDLNLTLGPGVDAPPIGAVVLELHGHDPAAAACDASIRAACDAAVIVDRVVWTASTGIVSPAPTTTPVPSAVDVPASIDGQPVLRGAAFVERVNVATDATSFLVGGWTPVTPEVYFCAFIPAPSPGVSLDPGVEALCGGLWFLDAPGDPQGTLRGSPPWVAARISVVTTVPAWGVPFVMRVHVEGPRVPVCPAGAAPACQRTVVEESLVWQGPAPSR